MSNNIELEMETDGRWIAEIASLPGVMAYGSTKEEATAKVEALVTATKTEPRLFVRPNGEVVDYSTWPAFIIE